MKKIIPILLFLFYANSSFAQFAWAEVGGSSGISANSDIYSFSSDTSGSIYAAGYFSNANGNFYVAKFNGTSWSELGGLNGLAANNTIDVICSNKIGYIYAGGDFRNAASNNYPYVAKWNDTSWNNIANLYPSYPGSIYGLCSDSLGNIYAGGDFKNSSGNHYVAKWNDTIWNEVGGLNTLSNLFSISYSSIIHSICKDGNGNIYAAGDFRNSSGKTFVAKWDKTTNTWSELGGLNALATNNTIFSICCDALGNIYAAGIFTNSFGKMFVAKWDKTTNTWSELGGLNALAANNNIMSVCSDKFGNIYTCGAFHNSRGKFYVAKWDGTSWSSMGHLNNQIWSLFSDANGNVYCGGSFTNTKGKQYVAKWSICPTTFSTVSGNICSGDFYPFNNINLTTSGTYYDTLQNYLGCDSIIILTLSVNSKSSNTINQTICVGHNYYFNGHFLNTAGTYFDTLINYLGCDSILTLNLIVGHNPIPICLVSVDSQSTHNIIVWEKNIAIKTAIDSFRIYREITTNNYSYIASIQKDSLSEYHDYIANPNSTSYKYKLSAIDTCGNLIPLSNYHNTIHLQNLGNGNFQWTLYQIENDTNPVTFYIVMRDDLHNGNFQPISNTIPGTNSTYTDVNYASYPNASYKVAVSWNRSCSPSKSTSTTYSNIEKLNSTGIQNWEAALFTISPNPTNTTTTITLTKAVDNATIKLINLTGQTIIEKQNQTGDHFNLDISQQEQGIYFVEIRQADNVWRTKLVKL